MDWILTFWWKGMLMRSCGPGGGGRGAGREVGVLGGGRMCACVCAPFSGAREAGGQVELQDMNTNRNPSIRCESLTHSTAHVPQQHAAWARVRVAATHLPVAHAHGGIVPSPAPADPPACLLPSSQAPPAHPAARRTYTRPFQPAGHLFVCVGLEVQAIVFPVALLERVCDRVPGLLVEAFQPGQVHLVQQVPRLRHVGRQMLGSAGAAASLGSLAAPRSTRSRCAVVWRGGCVLRWQAGAACVATETSTQESNVCALEGVLQTGAGPCQHG